ncbi:hypothetical protein [Microbacterium sp. E-13]|uniref:hypothetical protein n=1 Tax=Microbacterium sp. E-13 TaxID=3404048 RepID=UPI003CE6E1BC
MKTYDVSVSRGGDWWMVSIPELNGVTQTKTRSDAAATARDFIAVTLDIPADSFEVRVTSAGR